jgi:hypothetical protein
VKATAGTLAAVLALSLAVWTAFFLLMPQSPLTPQETLVVVGVCGAAVLGARWIRARLRGGRSAAGARDK